MSKPERRPTIGADDRDTGRFEAVVFDLDGVLTRTARLHARAWKEMFDAFLEARAASESEDHDPFDIEDDYRTYVDGKPRYDGARSFLESRGIELPQGEPDDDPDRETVCGVGNRKNERFRELVRTEGVDAFPDAVERLRSWRASGLKTAVITSSRNGRLILERAELAEDFDVVIDGVDAAAADLAGKPAPDIFLAAARRLDAAPGDTVVIEDAVAGIRAARAGDFGLVVGVDRQGDGERSEPRLSEHGADVVVADLRDLDLSALSEARQRRPSALDHLDEIAGRVAGGRLALFLDYDGTLTPIVDRPEDATLSVDMRGLLERYAELTTVAVVSGRDLDDVRDMVGIEGLAYAGSHGYDIAGPEGMRMQHDAAQASLPDLDAAEEELRSELEDVSGVRVERKRFAIAVHYRQARERDESLVERAVDAVVEAGGSLRKKGGKKIFEVQPDVDWHKGRAVRWLQEQLGLDGPDVAPMYVGDDVTDEDAFAALPEHGIGIRVGSPEEPTGADWVLEDPGELARFLDRLADRLERLREPSARDTGSWTLGYTEWNPDDQPLREALCAVGNGHIVTRGAFEEASAGGPHYPGTYVAGGYNRLESEVSGRVIENEDLVNWPNWLPLTFRPVDGEWLDIESMDLLSFDYRLHLDEGVLVRRMRIRDGEGRETSLECRRIVHLSQPHLAAIQWKLKPIDWSGEIEIRSRLDGGVVNDNVERYRGLANEHLEVLGMGREGDDAVYLSVRTNQARVRMTQAARTRVWEGGRPAPLRRETDTSEQAIGQRLFVTCHQQRELCVEKVVAIRTGYDVAISEPEVNARKDIRRVGRFDELLDAHATQWRHLWGIADIELGDSDDATQLILRLHVFHLLQTVSTNTIDRDVGVPARGWHGEAYRGHIFWDELFIFPTILLRIPELCRSLLRYRFRRLDEARHAAAQEGFEGAMYPWQSGSDGREESQVLHLNPESERWLPDTTHLQRHVNAAIAFNVWSYFQATGDIHFLSYYGAEMILEIARLFASLARYDSDRDRFEIHGVVGPDEFHTDDPNTESPGLRNNAYTNVMAAWVLRCACGVLERLDEERRGTLREAIGLEDEELKRWSRISRRLYIPFHGDGIISQFEGYERLQELDWEAYRREHGEALRLDRILEAEGDDVNRYKASKQADVLMLLYLFTDEQLEDLFDHMGYSFSQDLVERNIGYYLERTAHGSTLSRMVYAWILARRDRERAWGFWQRALRSDIDDIQGGTTPEGIHLGAMAGTVDLMHRGHTGIVMEKDVLWFDPMLPRELDRARMRIRYRDQWLTAQVTQATLTLSLDRGTRPGITIGVRGERFEMEQGETRTFDL